MGYAIGAVEKCAGAWYRDVSDVKGGFAVKKKKWLAVALAAALLCAPSIAHAEGSADLTENGGFRPYIEWLKSASWSSGTSTLPRRQVIKAYATVGETIYFGSSVSNAMSSVWMGDSTAKDIRVTTPNGTVLNYDVLRDSVGYISQSQEPLGPVQITAGGYDAFALDAPETGVYEFRFFSPSRAENSIGRVLTDSASPWNVDEVRGQGSGIAAWDITVAKDVSGTKMAIPGRVFANYLTMTLGSNDYASRDFLNSVVHVLTADGYLYETDFNGMNPDGFLFFGNNRGLIDNATGNSAYHSTIFSSNQMTAILGNIGFHLPNQPDTALDNTYRIFFNPPDAKILEYLDLENPQPPASITNFSFNGGAPVTAGQGGDFRFTAGKSSSFQLELKFNNDADNVVYIANTCAAGENVYHWDGKDFYGAVAAPGTYQATLRMKGGEYHFPLADVEVSWRGMQVRLENAPALAGATDPYLLYYDNSRTVRNGADLRFDIGQTAFSGGLTQLQGISSRKNDGVSNALRYTTSDDAYAEHFGGTSGGDTNSASVINNGYGNWKLFDIWTYFSADDYVYTAPFVVAPFETPKTGDQMPLWTMSCLFCVSGMVLLLRKARRKGEAGR